ncbi:MAG: hypothetical protein HKN82_12790 [Akkermansiaceae bacterium]|nr:hypothetical protein [Akkermansiaceae bacterium]NNM28237.1 hypothetical protein [Akkermansiaceae bacterium]
MKVAFTMDDLDGGFSSATGFISLENGQLLVEFQPKRFGFQLPAKEFGVALSEIERVRVKKGWFRCRLVLELNSLAALSRFPRHDENEVRLSIKKDQLVNARDLASQITLASVDRALEEM